MSYSLPCYKIVVPSEKTYKETSKDVPKIKYNEAQLRDLFKSHDTNQDGVLSKQELRNAFNSLGALIPKLRAYRAICHADGNGDGYISEPELDDVVRYAFRLGYTVN